MLGSTEIRTRIAGFRVLSANHYTMEPLCLETLRVLISRIPTVLGVNLFVREHFLKSSLKFNFCKKFDLKE